MQITRFPVSAVRLCKQRLTVSDQRHSRYLLTEGQINLLEETQNPSSDEARVLMLDIINGLFFPQSYIYLLGVEARGVHVPWCMFGGQLNSGC